jgi:hypothetical protein
MNRRSSYLSKLLHWSGRIFAWFPKRSKIEVNREKDNIFLLPILAYYFRISKLEFTITMLCINYLLAGALFGGGGNYR